MLLFLVILEALLEGEFLLGQRLFKLLHRRILHRHRDVRREDDIGDDTTFEPDTGLRKGGIQVLNHSSGVLFTAEGVSLRGFDRTRDESGTLRNVGINQLVVLVDICAQLHQLRTVGLNVLLTIA